MTTKPPTRKLGANRNEPARKQRTVDKNFSQSRDIHEDRSSVQHKMGMKSETRPKGHTKP